MRIKKQKAKGIDSDYLFPSPRSESHRSNFDTEWKNLRDALGFYTEDEDGKRKYKYRLHDFRETLLGLLKTYDEYTLSSLLGHTSTHAIKHYRKANIQNVREAAKVGFELLHNNKVSQNHLTDCSGLQSA